ncbi:profilin-2-like [Synchiropus splendidus]|uniref:profilin-2-like n=1 Tax=Synchiropus splendidus TaxID=270530 RepID=UPI00237D9D02|nr:profilin-2-like [Synchiropus splendidus]
MSWQDYVRNLMAPTPEGTVIVTEAAICGICDCSIWASSAECEIKNEEIAKLVGDRSGFSQSGPYVAGVKCRLLRDEMDDPQVMTMRLKTVADCSGCCYPVCIGKSKKALLYIKGTKDAQPGALSDRLFSIIAHLEKCGY